MKVVAPFAHDHGFLQLPAKQSWDMSSWAYEYTEILKVNRRKIPVNSILDWVISFKGFQKDDIINSGQEKLTMFYVIFKTHEHFLPMNISMRNSLQTWSTWAVPRFDRLTPNAAHLPYQAAQNAACLIDSKTIGPTTTSMQVSRVKLRCWQVHSTFPTTGLSTSKTIDEFLPPSALDSKNWA